MKKIIKYIIIISLSVFWLIGLTSQAQPKVQSPNIILIVADDLGWMDLSCYGSTFYETPNLDRLAANGVRFTNNYAASPVCSPTRASIMTGKYPTKTGVTDWIKGRQENGKALPYEKLIAPATAWQLALEETTIAEYAKANNYKTFLAGKWHLGEEEKYWPDYQGFEINIGGWSKGSPTGRMNDSAGGFFTPYKNPKLSDGPAGEYLTDRLTNECISFIKNNNKEPFFMMYSMYAIHNPLQAPAELIKKYTAKQKQLNIQPKDRFAKDEEWMKYEKGWRKRLVQDQPVYAAMVENMDSNIGRIINQLRELGIDDNTVIIFTSDNGGLSTAEGSPTMNGLLRAGKGWLYEGGIRVPLIIYWKGKATAGTVSSLPVNSIDIFPTIATIINNEYKKNETIDGQDIFQMMNQSSVNANRKLFWHYPHYSNQGGKPGAAIRAGAYKLIYYFESKTTELFNIATDVGEQKNIAAQHPKIVKQMSTQLLSWLKKVKAKEFSNNPDYDPASSGGNNPTHE
jgi:arylsulfatase A-like enzyme